MPCSITTTYRYVEEGMIQITQKLTGQNNANKKYDIVLLAYGKMLKYCYSLFRGHTTIHTGFNLNNQHDISHSWKSYQVLQHLESQLFHLNDFCVLCIQTCCMYVCVCVKIK